MLNKRTVCGKTKRIVLFALFFIYAPQGGLTQHTGKIEEFHNPHDLLLRMTGLNSGLCESIWEKIYKALEGKDNTVETIGLSLMPITIKIENKVDYKHFFRHCGHNEEKCMNSSCEVDIPCLFQCFSIDYETEQRGDLMFLNDFSAICIYTSTLSNLAFAPQNPKITINNVDCFTQLIDGCSCTLETIDHLMGFPNRHLDSLLAGFCCSSEYPLLTENSADDEVYLSKNIFFKPIGTWYFPAEEPNPLLTINYRTEYALFTSILFLACYCNEDCKRNNFDFMLTPQIVKDCIEHEKNFQKTFSWQWESIEDDDEISNSCTTKLTLIFSDQQEMEVTPGDEFFSSGPDENGKFTPPSKSYQVKNKGKSTIEYRINKTADWLNISPNQGMLTPGNSATVTLSINQNASKLKDGEYKDNVNFVNTTTGRGNTQREVKLDVGKEQTWQVTLTGQETNDYGGKLITELGKHFQTVDFGVRFDFKLIAEFVLKKKNDEWRYLNGAIQSATVAASDIFDPDYFFVKSTKCLNCETFSGIGKKPLFGKVFGKTVLLIWPNYIVNADVIWRYKGTTFDSGKKVDAGYSTNNFAAEKFFQLANGHSLPLKNREIKFEQEYNSANDQFRHKNRKPITVYHRYNITRLK